MRSPGNGSGLIRRSGRWLVARCSLALLLLSLQPVPKVYAQTLSAVPSDHEPLAWDEGEWGRFGTAELAAFAFLAAGTLALSTVLASDGPALSERSPMGRGILFDESIRDAIALRDSNAQEVAAQVSDALLLSLTVWPFLDSGGILIADQDQELATQLTAINGLSFATSWFFNELSKHLAQRERPYGRTCTTNDEERCTGRDRYRSFYSGHATISFTGASLVCVHHANLPIYGGAADPLACGSALTLATATALLRVVSDRHYATDVIVGAVMGFLSGFLIPTLLHYQRP